MTYFRTKDGEGTAVLFITLKIPAQDWFKQSIITALLPMCTDENWTQDGTATVTFARDKSNEMLDSILIGSDPPVTKPFTVGEYKMLSFAATIPGWILCDGQYLSRTDYADLFAVIGTTYGAGDGSTTFRLPSFRGRFPAGHIDVPGGDMVLGSYGGEATHTLTLDEIPAHTHTDNVASATSAGGTTLIEANRSSAGTRKVTGSAGGGLSHENRPPYTPVYMMIYHGVGG